MQKPKLELFYYPECPYCQLVLEALDDLDIQVDLRNIRKSEQDLARLMKDTGRRTVPCLYIDNRPMHESRDIVKWLNDNQQKLK